MDTEEDRLPWEGIMAIHEVGIEASPRRGALRQQWCDAIQSEVHGDLLNGFSC